MTLAAENLPDDSAPSPVSKANLALGRLYCFSEGDWRRGLPYLAMGSDAKLAVVAKKEFANPPDWTKIVDVVS